jgi:hypothetical protein
MTYTFKLARRLAVSRHFGVLSALAFIVACSGESTAPSNDVPGTPNPPPSLAVYPQAVTIEVNQPVQFRGHRRGPRSDSSAVHVAWSASGGVISPNGTFSSSETGTFKVIGRGPSLKHADTSTVLVVARAVNVARLVVAPETVTVQPGGTRTFSAKGYRPSGRSAVIGVTWSATGGEIDGGGRYTAGETGGTYEVIATNTAGTLADTALVTIPEAASVPPPVPAPPAPAPPAEPRLERVVVAPATVAVSVSATRQFLAYGRSSSGDSVTVPVAFRATGGTISSSGLFTAGASQGTFRVIATSSGMADTAVVTVTSPTAPAPTPAPSPTPVAGTGVPFGPFGVWEGSSLKSGTDVFTLSQASVSASVIVERIAAARAAKSKMVLALTGGAHDNYLTNGVFDRSKWEARLNTFNTPAIRAAIAAGVADGTIIGNTVMDEPNVSGGGDGNTWGPPGTMTKARVDSLCGYAKAMFPTLPSGVQHRYDIFEPTKSYRVCDFVTSQYSERVGNLTTFRDGALAMGRRDGYSVLFSLNILNGGTQDKDGVYDCSGPGQAGKGTYGSNCRMTADQLRQWGTTLGPAGCALLMWLYDADYIANSANQQAFRDIASRLATVPAKSCARRS